MKKIVLAVACVGAFVCFGAENLDEANKAYNEGNFTKAVEIYKKLCEAKEAKACSSLGLMYRAGKGVSEDANLSKQFYKKACDAGDTSACSDANWQ